jgi:tetratricopeptide (TPR) repeat protein
MYNLRASYYYDEGAYEEAIDDCRKSLEIFQFGWPMNRIFKCNIRLGNDVAAVENLKEIVSMDPSFNDSEMIDTVFLDFGIEGIIKWFILWLQEGSSSDFFLRINLSSRIACLYSLLGDAEQTLVWLEKSLEAGDSNILSKKFSKDFAFLRGDPKFQAIFNELGL